MHRSSLFALIASALVFSACSGPADPGDAGTDSGSDPDAGNTGHDAGPRDSGLAPDGGPTGCTSGCAFVELALGSDHSCARRENGEVWCWGRNKEGELGDNRHSHTSCGTDGDGMPVDCSSTPVQVRTNAGGVIGVLDATQISAQGALSTCAVRTSGELWCWGYEGIAPVNGNQPELRFAAKRVEDFGEVSQVSDGWLHTCMVQGTSAQGICYGYNDSGQLGVGDNTDIRVPDDARPVRDAAGTGTLTGIEEIVASGFGDTTCARTADGVFCWGTNLAGQLGDGLSTHPSQTPCSSSSIASYDCSRVPVQVGGDTPLTDVVQLAAGVSHVCALDTAGAVWCWGDNRAAGAGQPAGIGEVSLPAQVAGLGEAVEITAGGHSTCARISDGTVWCWGYNYRGQLGDGEPSHETCTFGTDTGDCSHAPVQVTAIDDATHVELGNSHACAVRASGQIWCWGLNDNRELGDGTRTTSNVPVRVIGLPD